MEPNKWIHTGCCMHMLPSQVDLSRCTFTLPFPSLPPLTQSFSCPGREVVREGALSRFRASSQESGGGSGGGDEDEVARSYHFILCTDLLVFARVSTRSRTSTDGGATSTPQLRWMQAYHLALMEKPRMEERSRSDAPFPFSLATAQSVTPLLVSAGGAAERVAWIQTIASQIDLIRTRLNAAASNTIGPLHALRASKRLSRFLGPPHALGTEAITMEDVQTNEAPSAVAASASSSSATLPAATSCRLCLRAFHAIFRRYAHCYWCGERVCAECAQGRVRLPLPLQPFAALKAPATNATSNPEENATPRDNMNASPNGGGSFGSSASASTSSSSSSLVLPSAAAAAAAFFSKATASVSSMGGKLLRRAVSKLNERDGGASVANDALRVCDACHMPLAQEIDEVEERMRREQEQNRTTTTTTPTPPPPLPPQPRHPHQDRARAKVAAANNSFGFDEDEYDE